MTAPDDPAWVGEVLGFWFAKLLDSDGSARFVRCVTVEPAAIGRRSRMHRGRLGLHVAGL